MGLRPMRFRQIYARDLAAGDKLSNLGLVQRAELEPDAAQVKVHLANGRHVLFAYKRRVVLETLDTRKKTRAYHRLRSWIRGLWKR
jgi:hypothetical protein